MDTNKQFMPFFHSYIMEQYGFDKPCFGYYDDNEQFVLKYIEDYDILIDNVSCKAPLVQQVLSFFKDHNFHLDISKSDFYISIDDKTFYSDQYEDAETTAYECALKLVSEFSQYIDTSDRYMELTDKQKESIYRGLKDIEEGRVIPHNEVMDRINMLFKSKQIEEVIKKL